MCRLRENLCRILACTALQPCVLFASIQCVTMATEVVEVATKTKEDVVILTIIFSTECELFTSQEAHNSRRNIYFAFHN